MDERVPSRGNSKVTLKDILMGCGQPISEEQAWALCYQCCCKLKQMAWRSRQVPALQGAENILIHQDGTVSFISCCDTRQNPQLENKLVERLGRVIYTALDWGLTSDLERALSEPLDNLLRHMLGLHTATIKPQIGFQDPVTLNNIIKVCAGRLFTPAEAGGHYRAVCRVHFAEHKEFCKLLLTIERSKRSLKKLDAEDVPERDSLVQCNNWGNLWSNVIKELRLGVRLRNAEERPFEQLPIEYTLTPYELLMNDIRYKRYTLREVKDSEKNKICKSAEDFIMEFIRSQTLRPASERKLKERSEEEPSLHELLMTEIKSTKKLRLTSTGRKRLRQDEDSGAPNSLDSSQNDVCLSSSDCRAKSARRRLQAIDLMDISRPYESKQGDIGWCSECSSETSSDSKFSDLTSSSTDLLFIPVLTSSQVDLKTSGFLNPEKMKSSCHRRSRSFESSFQRITYGHSRRFLKDRPSPTIAELVPTRLAIVKAEMAEFLESNGYCAFAGSRVCFSCHKKRLFFTWPYTCQICERVACPECCFQMLMPFKQCMHLPASFFKTLVLTREDDPACQAQTTQRFCREILHWDCSSVPLVFDHQDVAEDAPFHKRTMKNWSCMDICIKCKEHILEVIDLSHRCVLPSDGLKSWSISES